MGTIYNTLKPKLQKATKTNQIKAFLSKDDVKKDIQKLLEEGYSASAIAKMLNETISPKLKEEEKRVPKQVFKDEKYPKGAKVQGDIVIYKSLPVFRASHILKLKNT